MPRKRRSLRRKVVPHKTTLMFKGGEVPPDVQDMFRRVFWKSVGLAGEAKLFWQHVRDNDTAAPKESPVRGVSIKEWKDWREKRNMSVGQFYNMIHGLVGAGMLEKKEGRWRVGTGFMRQLEQLLILYSSESRYDMVFDRAG